MHKTKTFYLRSVKTRNLISMTDMFFLIMELGPTLLFVKVNQGKEETRRFYACSACRDRKDCNFFQWEDEKVYQLSGYIYLFIFDVCDILLRMYEINLLRDGRYHVFWSRDWSLYLL